MKDILRMMTLVVPSPHSSSWVRLSSIMFFAAGCATSISRRIALPSFVSLRPTHVRFLLREYMCAHEQNTTHWVQYHLQHGFRAQTCSDNIRDGLKQDVSAKNMVTSREHDLSSGNIGDLSFSTGLPLRGRVFIGMSEETDERSFGLHVLITKTGV